MAAAYDSLIPPYRQIVDRLAAYTRLSDWHGCRSALTSTYEALLRHEGGVAPERDFAHMVAALIERVDTPEIANADQAVIYAVSAESAHRDMASDWFDEHPEDFERAWTQFRHSHLH